MNIETVNEIKGEIADNVDYWAASDPGHFSNNRKGCLRELDELLDQLISESNAKTYDSTADTLKHIRRVSQLMNEGAIELLKRANVHDASKLVDPEKSGFDEFTPKLAGTTYGADEYKELLGKLKPMLDHHYANNSHHPEHTFFKEKWADINGYEGLYQISDIGRVRRVEGFVDRGKQGVITLPEMIMNPHVTPKGYVRIRLTKDKSGKNLFVHTLVCSAFNGLPTNSRQQVNHKDGNKQNNRSENLEWVSPSDNLIHAYENELRLPNVKHIVHCLEHDITTFGIEKMAFELRNLGYNKISSAGIWRCINSDSDSSHLNLHFESYNIDEYQQLNSPVNGFDLFDLFEMFFDWKAASERHNDGDIMRSIEVNTKRFDLSPQLVAILKNTAQRLGWTK